MVDIFVPNIIKIDLRRLRMWLDDVKYVKAFKNKLKMFPYKTRRR